MDKVYSAILLNGKVYPVRFKKTEQGDFVAEFMSGRDLLGQSWATPADVQAECVKATEEYNRQVSKHRSATPVSIEGLVPLGS